MAKRRSNKLNEESRQLLKKVKDAEQYHRKVFADKAEADMSYLRGDTSYMPSDFEYDIIDPNLIFSTIRNYVPSLIPRNTKILVKPRVPDFGEPKKDNIFSSDLMERDLQYYQQKLKMIEQDRKCSLGALGHGVSYAFNAWAFETKHYNPTILKDQPIHRFVSGIDLIPDPDGLEFEDKSFVARIIGKRYSEMKRLGYDNINEDLDNSGDFGSYHAKTKQIILPKFYEIWDKNTEKVLVMSEHGGEESLHDEREFDIEDGFPFTPWIYNPMVDYYYGPSLVQQLVKMQKFITLIVSYIAKHAKSATPKYAAFMEYLDSNAKRAFKSGKILDLVPLRRRSNDDKTDINQIIATLQTPQLPPDVYNSLNIVRDLFNVVSGVHEEARGGKRDSGTATQSLIVDSYLKSRVNDYGEISKQAMVESRSKMIKLVQKHWKKDKFLRFNLDDIENEYFYGTEGFKQNSVSRGKYVFVKWSSADISGEYDLEVGVGEGLPVNEEYEYKKALNDFNMLANDPFTNPKQLRFNFWRRIGIPNPEKLWKDPPPPPPDKPKANVNISLRGDELPDGAMESVLKKGGFVQEQQSALPAGVPGAEGGSNDVRSHPRDIGMMREFITPGLNKPPRLPE